MLFRDDGDDLIAIPQPSHAWLSGQIMRAWGNDGFAAPFPREEVCLGAEQHDIGWLPWEAAPTLNPREGRPHEFREIGVREHTALWSNGVRMALGFGRYPALLVSLHANTIYGYFNHAKATPDDAAAMRGFLAAQARFQRTTLGELAAIPRYAAAATDGAAERNRLLVAMADRLSLEVCWGVRGEKAIPNVPRGSSSATLRLRSPSGDPSALVLDPWPFSADRVDLLCEGRRLRGRFADEAAMREALDRAETVAIAATLHPA
jgi:hypothetical protein